MNRTVANKEEATKETKKEKTNVVELKLVTGGGEPPVSSGNWLKDLEDGTVFFVQSKLDFKDFNLLLFRLEGKAGPHNKLICIRSPNLPKEIYVDPHRFCNQYNLYHTEGVMKVPEKQEEQDDTDSDRQPSPGGEENKDLA